MAASASHSLGHTKRPDQPAGVKDGACRRVEPLGYRGSSVLSDGGAIVERPALGSRRHSWSGGLQPACSSERLRDPAWVLTRKHHLAVPDTDRGAQ